MGGTVGTVWDYKLDDLTGMLEQQDDDKGSDYLWEWIITSNEGLIHDFLRYFLDRPMTPLMPYLPHHLLKPHPTLEARAERVKLLIDIIKDVENLLSENPNLYNGRTRWANRCG
jgi:hypothetical protein